MIRSAAGPAAARWGPYALAGTLLLVDYLWLSRSLSLVGTHYGPSALNRGDYNDVLSLSSLHYLRPGHIIHPIPYVDDRIEYPVLLGLTLWLPTWLPGGPATWFAAAGVLTAAATFGSIALLRRHHPASVWWIAASPALLLDGGINWDLIGIFFLVGGVVWLGERRLGLSGASTALGTCFKLFPVVVAPMAVAALGSRWSRARSGRATAPGTDAAGRDVARWVVPFGAVSAVVFVPFLILNASNTLWFIRFNDLRPQKDSLWELPARVLGSTLVGSGTINALSLVAVVAAVAYGARMVWLTPEPSQFRSVTLATALTMVVWMGVNKVWNPQYILWVFATSALAGMPARFGVALGALSVYDYGFEFILRRPDQHNPYLWVGYIMEVARTVLFVLMVVWVVARLRAGRHAPAEPVGGNPAAVAT